MGELTERTQGLFYVLFQYIFPVPSLLLNGRSCPQPGPLAVSNITDYRKTIPDESGRTVIANINNSLMSGKGV